MSFNVFPCIRDEVALLARERFWNFKETSRSLLMFFDCVFLQLIQSCDRIPTHITSNFQMMVENVLTHHVKVGGLVLFALAAHLQGVALAAAGQVRLHQLAVARPDDRRPGVEHGQLYHAGLRRVRGRVWR